VKAKVTEAMALVRMDSIVKRFGAVTALDGASLEVEAGEVHALLGENGAGKTTLMRILAGRLSPDAGEVWLDGKRITRFAPQEAQRHGVGDGRSKLHPCAPADRRRKFALGITGSAGNKAGRKSSPTNWDGSCVGMRKWRRCRSVSDNGWKS
jgi:ABC-type molybdenum transport system ATPase subunit/photorepair protein PhrA